MPKSLLWAAKIERHARLPGDQRCLGCHSHGGVAKPPAIALHPDVMMLNTVPTDSPGFLPLFNERGEVDPRGRISCMTCHLPHGRVPRDASNADKAPHSPPLEFQRAMRLDLRRYVPPVVCNTCHGLDAIRRVLYYHDPLRRRGPLSGKPAPFR